MLLAGPTAVLWPIARRPPWFTPQLRTGVPVALSLLYGAGALVADRSALSGSGGTLILLSLTFIAVRHCRQRWAVACGVLTGTALLALPVRYYYSVTDENMLPVVVLGLVLLGIVAGLAG